MSYRTIPALAATVLGAATLLVATAAFSHAADNAALPEKYLRVSRNKDNKPQALETAVVSFVPKSGAQNVAVDLVSAIHIGDAKYFETLNRLFQEYDVVLYEMVKDEEVEPAGFKSRQQTPLAMLQRMLPAMLDLQFQVESIDYTAKNFVHADVTPKELGEAMRKRGENRVSLVIKVIKEVLQQYQEEWAANGSLGGDVSEAEIFAFLTQKEGTRQLKELLADKLDELGADLGLGATLDSVLVVDRNKAALKELKHQLASRDDNKPLRIAIYYGAAHMPDLARQLTTQFYMQPHDVSWIQAWDITSPPKTTALQGLLQLLQENQ